MMRSTGFISFFVLRALVVALLAFSALSAQAQSTASIERGLALSAQLGCVGCHGEDGNLVLEDDYPKLGGQHYDYLVVALKAYRSGERDHAIMSSFARDLTDQQIQDLSAWYASQSGLVEWDAQPPRRFRRGRGGRAD